MQLFWARLCCRYWNRNTTPKSPILNREVLAKDVELFRAGSDTCWSSKFLHCMAHIGLIPNRISIGELRGKSAKDIMAFHFGENQVIEATMKVYDQFLPLNVDVDPRTAVSKGVAVVKHHVWFHNEQCSHLEISAPIGQIFSLMKFRLGCSGLRVYDHTISDRCARVCRLCNMNKMEDEFHVVFECVA